MPPSGGDGFIVDPDRLRNLAGAFLHEAGRLGDAIPGFEAESIRVEQAFGLLGPSDELYFEYVGLVRETVGQLQDVRVTIEQLGAGLRWAAHSYQEAEAGSAVPLPALPA